MDDPKILFGRHLKLLRKRKGWSQERLAFECNMDRTYIGGVERGERNISIVNICRLAECLGLSPNSLLDFGKLDSED